MDLSGSPNDKTNSKFAKTDKIDEEDEKWYIIKIEILIIFFTS